MTCRTRHFLLLNLQLYPRNKITSFQSLLIYNILISKTMATKITQKDQSKKTMPGKLISSDIFFVLFFFYKAVLQANPYPLIVPNFQPPLPK